MHFMPLSSYSSIYSDTVCWSLATIPRLRNKSNAKPGNCLFLENFLLQESKWLGPIPTMGRVCTKLPSHSVNQLITFYCVLGYQPPQFRWNPSPSDFPENDGWLRCGNANISTLNEWQKQTSSLLILTETLCHNLTRGPKYGWQLGASGDLLDLGNSVPDTLVLTAFSIESTRWLINWIYSSPPRQHHHLRSLD